jgi:hypothetical protein
LIKNGNPRSHDDWFGKNDEQQLVETVQGEKNTP